MQTFSLRSSLWLPRPLDEVFDFFADARNLEILTPPWLAFQILPPAPTDDMETKLAQLRELGELKSQGVLSEEEFAAQKRRILGS